MNSKVNEDSHCKDEILARARPKMFQHSPSMHTVVIVSPCIRHSSLQVHLLLMSSLPLHHSLPQPVTVPLPHPLTSFSPLVKQQIPQCGILQQEAAGLPKRVFQSPTCTLWEVQLLMFMVSFVLVGALYFCLSEVVC